MPLFGFRRRMVRLWQKHRGTGLLTGLSDPVHDTAVEKSKLPQKNSLHPSENLGEEIVGNAQTPISAPLESARGVERASVECRDPLVPPTSRDSISESIPPVVNAHAYATSEPYSRSRPVSPAPSSSLATHEPVLNTQQIPKLKLLKKLEDDSFSISTSTTSTSLGSNERTRALEQFSGAGTKLTREISCDPDVTYPALQPSQFVGAPTESEGALPQILVRAATSASVVVEARSSGHNHDALLPLRERLGIPSQNRRYSTPHKRRAALSISSGTRTDVIFPSKISVDVHLRFNGERGMFDSKHIDDFEWTAPASYLALNPDETIDKHVKAHSELEDHEIYIRHGSCQVKGPSNMDADGEFSKVDDIEDLNQFAIRDVCGFISKNPFYQPSLEVYWDFSSARLKPVHQQDFAETIQLGLQKKMCRNFRDQEYIPKCDLEVFLDVSVARTLVEQDASLKMNQLEKDKFLKKVQTLPARKLLVLCVFVGFKLDKLKHLIYEHGFSDKKLPKKNTECQDADCTNKYALMWAHINAFFPKEIEKDRKCRVLAADKVVPLQHPVSGKHELGQGAFGLVTQVMIDRSLHSLSGDPDCPFALKQFPGTDRANAAFHREVKMLEVLSQYSHDNIAGHIASWSQADHHFILYPKAAYNLRSFMIEVEPFTLEAPVMMWFFKQLCGLAEAIDHVHVIKKRPTQSLDSEDDDTIEGCHHDIKPENILVFERVLGKDPTFKIADFGAGDFHPGLNDTKKSKQYSKTRGTETYFAPDMEMHGNVSRSFDMWALGCVFLELHLWLFRFHWEDGAGFSTKRAEFSGSELSNSDDRFWEKTQAGYVLKPAVERVLQELEEKCHKMRAFNRLVKIIRQLLEPDRRKRWKASKLIRSLQRIIKQLSPDLEANPDFYLEAYQENEGGAQTNLELPYERINPLVSSVGSSRSPSSSSHSRRGTQENGQKPLGVAGSPTSSVVIETGMAVDSVEEGVDDNSSDTELGSPDGETHNPMLSSMSQKELQSLESLKSTLKVARISGRFPG